MNREHSHNVVFGSLGTSLAGARGHRSLGDESTMAAAVAAASKQLGTKTASLKGWNNSTRASPLWRQKLTDKENNAKPAVPKKFQHVQSKLNAPIFQQRTGVLQRAAGGMNTGALSEGCPLQTSSGANAAYYAHGHLSSVVEDDAMSPEVPIRAPFVTMRHRSASSSPVRGVCSAGQDDDRLDVAFKDFAPSAVGVGEARVDTQSEQVASLARSPCQSSHPSVTALYQYAQEVQTPVSGRASQPLQEFGQIRRDGPPGNSLQKDDGLTGSFAEWLESQGIDTAPLAEASRAKLHALWRTAKEALRLQAFVEQLKDTKDQAEQQPHDRGVQSICVATAINSSETVQVQPSLQPTEGEILLASLAVAGRPSPPQPQVGCEAVHAAMNFSAPLSVDADHGEAQDKGCEASLIEAISTSVSPHESSGTRQPDDDATSASVASWTYQQDQMLETVADSSEDGHVASVPDLSPSATPCSQPFASNAASLFRAQAPASSDLVPEAHRATPGLSVISRSPEHIPFAMWATGVASGVQLQAGQSPLASVCTDYAASTAVSMPNALAAAAACASESSPGCTKPALTPSQSAGLSVASQPPPAVAFTAWVKHQQVIATPGTHSPQLSPAVQVPCGAESVSKPYHHAGWDNSPLTTPPTRSSGHPKATPADAKAQLRSNPLFEFDSPASSMSMPLPERADAPPGLAVLSPTLQQSIIPSLASTPMSESRDSPLSLGASPFPDLGSPSASLHGVACIECPDAFCITDFDIGDMPTPAAGFNALPVDSPVPSYQRADDAPSPQSEADAPSFSNMQGAANACESPCSSVRFGGPQVMGAEQVNSPDGDFTETADDALGAMGSVPTASDLDAADLSATGSPATVVDFVPELDCGTSGTEVEENSEDGGTSPGDETAAVSLGAHEPGDPSPTPSPVESGGITTDQQPSGPSSDGKAAPGPTRSTPGEGSRKPIGLDTPASKTPASPASTVYATPLDAFPSPQSQVSLASILRRTAIRNQSSGSTPTGYAPSNLGARSGPDFTFGRVQRGYGAQAPTPELTAGMAQAEPSFFTAFGGEGSTPSIRAPAGIAAFGSPLPLMQLTPVQMRVLDQLASKVLTAVSPTPASRFLSGRDSPSDVGLEQDQAVPNTHRGATPARSNFSFAQLLANLKSPMPAGLHPQHRQPAAEGSDTKPPQRQHAQCSQGATAMPIAAPSSKTAQDGASATEVEPMTTSPMPHVSELMTRLSVSNGPVVATDASAWADISQPDTSIPETVSNAVDPQAGAASDVMQTAAFFAYAQLLAHLSKPRPAGPPPSAQPAARPSTSAPGTLGLMAGVDSPMTCDDVHDSPATSEAASFGFSTAAKQMSRITQATTPGHGGVSFMPWAHGTSPTFPVDTDRGGGRHRGSRTPPTPVSFCFEAPLGACGEDITPAAGRLQRRMMSAGAEAAPSPGLAAVYSPAHSRRVMSPAFSFGLQLGKLPAADATPAALQRSARPMPLSSPALSLGMWALHLGDQETAQAAMAASPTPSQLGFTFANCNPAALSTPILANLADAAASAAAALTADESSPTCVEGVAAAVEQMMAIMSPTLFGMGFGAGSPIDTPGVTQPIRAFTAVGEGLPEKMAGCTNSAPGPASFWAALLGGGLHSPMPAGMQSRLCGAQPEKPPSVHDEPPLGSAVRSAGLEAHALAEQVDLDPPGKAGRSEEELEQRSAAPADAPPLYEDLPELIARGLCLSASTSLPLPADESARGSVTKASSMKIEDPIQVLAQTSEGMRALAPLSAAAADATGSPPLERLFKTTHRGLDSDLSVSACLGHSACDYLVIESVSDSNRSRDEASTAQAGHTTEPAPTPSRLVKTALSGCNRSAAADAASVDNSPVMSLGVVSQDRASSRSAVFLAAAREQDLDVGRSSDASGAAQGLYEQREAARTKDNPAPVQRQAAVAPRAQSEPGNSSLIPSVQQATAACGSPLVSMRRSTDGLPKSPLTFSYLGSGTPPSTPPTAELASVSRGQAPFGSRPAGQPSPRGGGQFWAPSSSGMGLASGERVTLEAMNRRICANADLLLDFQGSPGQPLASPLATTSGAVTPRMKAPGLPAPRSGANHVNPFRKSWDVALSSPANQLAMKTITSQAPPAPGPAAAVSVDSATSPVARSAKESVTAAADLRKQPTDDKPAHAVVRPGQGPPLQELVAAGIDNTFALAAASLLQPGPHKPISSRLGLWRSAVWDVQNVQPSLDSQHVAAGAVQPSAPQQRNAAVQAQVATPPPAAAAGKPQMASRDVQTTPRLEKLASLGDKEVPEERGHRAKPEQHGSAAPAVRKPFRSRIPAPVMNGAPTMARRSEGTEVRASAPVISSSSTGAGAEDSEQSASVERVIRRRRLTTHGGAQRIPVKAPAQRDVGPELQLLNVVSEEEVKRRARVMGVRISPYLRSKATRVKVPEQQQAKKG